MLDEGGSRLDLLKHVLIRGFLFAKGVAMKKFGFLAMFLGLSMLVVGCAEDKGKKDGKKDGKPAAGAKDDKGAAHEPAEGAKGADKPAH